MDLLVLTVLALLLTEAKLQTTTDSSTSNNTGMDQPNPIETVPTQISTNTTIQIQPSLSTPVTKGCQTVKCKEHKPCEEVTGYKVACVLFGLLLLILILLLFFRPTLKRLQTRLSDRRRSRWIGPTQTVSYHRGKSAVQDDKEKRLSYPALERLVVSSSREPSSNRNSDYNC